MTATSSLQRLWLAALCLLAATVPGVADEPGAEVKLTWKFYDDGGSIVTQQDRLEAIRSVFSPLMPVRGKSINPAAECGTDLELPSMLAPFKEPLFALGNPRWYICPSSARAIRQFQFDSTQHTGWITLADEQPPLVTTEYHKVVIRLLQSYGAWKTEADARLLKSLNGPGDPGFFAVIEWELARSGR